MPYVNAFWAHELRNEVAAERIAEGCATGFCTGREAGQNR